MAYLEHVNLTVADPKATGAMLCELFDWRIRWEGEGMDGAGYTVHVGTSDSYLAVYAQQGQQSTPDAAASYTTRGGLNHIGVVVDDLDLIERRVLARGYRISSHHDYEPGRRFYFHDENGVEIEVVCYDAPTA